MMRKLERLSEKLEGETTKSTKIIAFCIPKSFVCEIILRSELNVGTQRSD
jgi:hypothetical protein